MWVLNFSAADFPGNLSVVSYFHSSFLPSHQKSGFIQIPILTYGSWIQRIGTPPPTLTRLGDPVPWLYEFRKLALDQSEYLVVVSKLGAGTGHSEQEEGLPLVVGGKVSFLLQMCARHPSAPVVADNLKRAWRAWRASPNNGRLQKIVSLTKVRVRKNLVRLHS